MESTKELPRRPDVPTATWLSNLPWWALIIVATGLLLIYLILANPNYHETFVYLQAGVAMTLRITLIAFPIATVIGLLAGLARTTNNTILYTVSTIYVEVIRGIPLVVLMLTFAFGLIPVFIELAHQLAAWGLTWSKSGLFFDIFTFLKDPELIRKIPYDMRAIVALAFGYGAYEAEVFRAGIQSIGKGQMEAGRSLGMSYFQTMRYIILPQAVRRVLPPLGNDFIALLKDSSLATVLAVTELTQLSRMRRASTFRAMETYNVVAFLYLAMTLTLSALVRLLERKLKIEE
jgi:polar amino acid transport system permease protein